MNMCTTSRVNNVTPHEKYYERNPDISHRQIFDTIASVHIPNRKRQKVDPKLKKCIIVGYLLEQKGYRCFNPSTRTIRVSRDVVFDESASWYTVNSAPSEPIAADLDIDSEEDDRLEAYIRGQSNLNQVEWTSRAFS